LKDGTMLEGTVKRWFDERGFGFIAPDSGSDIFVHAKECADGAPCVGDRVSFDMGTGRDGRPLATNVKVLD
jgi:cold shock CspA family protein